LLPACPASWRQVPAPRAQRSPWSSTHFMPLDLAPKAGHRSWSTRRGHQGGIHPIQGEPQMCRWAYGVPANMTIAPASRIALLGGLRIERPRGHSSGDRSGSRDWLCRMDRCAPSREWVHWRPVVPAVANGPGNMLCAPTPRCGYAERLVRTIQMYRHLTGPVRAAASLVTSRSSPAGASKSMSPNSGRASRW
jgi:hypothetical protein